MNYGKLYDEHVAESYDEDALGLLKGVRDLGLRQISRAALPPNATILDLGAGTGETLVGLARDFPRARLIGVDLSAKMIEVARRKLTLETHVADACDAEKFVAPGSAHLVVAHFLTTFVDRPRFFRVVSRTLHRDGVFSVVSSPAEAFHGVRSAVGRLLGSASVDAASPAPQNAAALERELRDAGFEVLASEEFRRPIVFKTFDEALQWGLRSGFFAHAIAALGDERMALLRTVTRDLFPFNDEYVGVAVLARLTRNG